MSTTNRRVLVLGAALALLVGTVGSVFLGTDAPNQKIADPCLTAGQPAQRTEKPLGTGLDGLPGKGSMIEALEARKPGELGAVIWIDAFSAQGERCPAVRETDPRILGIYAQELKAVLPDEGATVYRAEGSALTAVILPYGSAESACDRLRTLLGAFVFENGGFWYDEWSSSGLVHWTSVSGYLDADVGRPCR